MFFLINYTFLSILWISRFLTEFSVGKFFFGWKFANFYTSEKWTLNSIFGVWGHFSARIHWLGVKTQQITHFWKSRFFSDFQPIFGWAVIFSVNFAKFSRICKLKYFWRFESEMVFWDVSQHKWTGLRWKLCR